MAWPNWMSLGLMGIAFRMLGLIKWIVGVPPVVTANGSIDIDNICIFGLENRSSRADLLYELINTGWVYERYDDLFRAFAALFERELSRIHQRQFICIVYSHLPAV